MYAHRYLSLLCVCRGDPAVFRRGRGTVFQLHGLLYCSSSTSDGPRVSAAVPVHREHRLLLRFQRNLGDDIFRSKYVQQVFLNTFGSS